MTNAVPLLYTLPSIALDASGAAVGFTQLSLENMRSFALLTAVCALAATIAQDHSATPGSDTTLAEKLVLASRQMFSCRADSDLERPESSSLLTRFLHSNTLHYLGKTQLAMHLLRSAFSLAISMRIYDEGSLTRLDPLEAQRRRIIFWTLYQGDHSSSVLNNAPSLMVEVWLGQPITLAELDCSEARLIGKDHSLLGGSFEAHMLHGFKFST